MLVRTPRSPFEIMPVVLSEAGSKDDQMNPSHP